MNCLYCNKPLTEKHSLEEHTNQWHKKCVKAFFDTTKLPQLDISAEQLKLIAIESTNKGYTVPGVQKKLSLHLTQETTPRLTLVNYPTGYILKPQTEEYETLPEAEYLVMQMAKLSGIRTVPFALIKLNEQDTFFAYITKRIDRVQTKDGLQMYAMEDFCQLEERLTNDKYKGSYERCAKVISKYSSRVGFDLSELFLRLVFCFIVGNSDMHLKNFSLIETMPASGEYALSSAYDLLPVNAVLPEDTEQFALTMNGRKRKLKRKDFLLFAKSIGLNEKTAEKIISDIIKLQAKYLALCDEAYLSASMKNKIKEIILERIQILAN